LITAVRWPTRRDRTRCSAEIKLIVALHWHTASGWPLNSLRDRVGVSEVVPVALPERFGISGRYLPYVMAERT
jgi:hypothetical protein